MKERPPRSWSYLVMALLAILVVVGLWSVLSPPPPAQWFADRALPEGNGVPATAAAAINAGSETSAMPNFDVVRITRSGTGVVAGRAMPSSTVDILVDGQKLGVVQADGRGEWVLIFDTPIKAGSAELTLNARLAGAAPVASEEAVVVVIPDQEGAPFADNGEGVIAFKTPRHGAAPSVVLQRPSAHFDPKASLSLDTVSYTDAGWFGIAGQATPRSDLRIYLNNVHLGDVRVQEDGRWSLSATPSLDGPGEVVRIDQVASDGKVRSRLEVPYLTAKSVLLAESATSGGAIKLQTGQHLWLVSRPSDTGGELHTVIYANHEDYVKDAALVYPGQVTAAPRQVNGSEALAESEAVKG